jgi:hypothetical protein
MLYCACVLPIATYGSRLWLYDGVAMKGPLDSLCKMQRCACLWITGAFKTSPMGAAERLAGMPLIHLHVKKLVERSHVHTCMLQASHASCRLVDRDHKFSIETLEGQIRGDLISSITEAWLNLDFSSLDLDPVNRFNQPGLRPKDLYHRHIIYDIVSSLPKTDRITRNSWPTGSTQMCLPLPYPSSQLWPSASGMRGTFTMTGLQPVLLRLTMPNCKQLRMASIKHTMLVWKMYVRYMFSPTLQTCSS